MGSRDEEDPRGIWEVLGCVTAWLGVVLADQGWAENVVLRLPFLDGV